MTGSWRIERQLCDRVSGRSGTFTGSAVFSDDDDGGLVHDEAGTLDWSGQPPVPTTRRLLLGPTSAASAMEVFFADGRPFHRLDLSTGLDLPEHPCAADLYRGTFCVSHPDSWSYRWTVTGPAKNLLLESTLRRNKDRPASGSPLG